MVREKSEKSKTFSKLKVREFCICIFPVHNLILWKEFESEDRNIDDQQKKLKQRVSWKLRPQKQRPKDPKTPKTQKQRPKELKTPKLKKKRPPWFCFAVK